MIKFILIFNTSGKPRIVRFYDTPEESPRQATQNEVTSICLRTKRQEGILNHKDYTVVFRHYGNLVFAAGITEDENELATLELLQNFVEIMMKYFTKLCEADIMLNMDKVYMILDEMITEGYIAETNQTRILVPLRLLDTVRK